jgi:SAM-dependent methyltransferase
MRACPLCGSTDVRFISHLEYAVFDDNPLQPVYDMVSCKECNFTYCDTQITTEQLKQYYSTNKHYLSEGVGVGSPSELKRYRELLHVIEMHRNDRSSKIVDIGAAGGGLLLALHDRGYTNLTAIELLPVDLAVSRPFETLFGMVEDIPLPDKSVDIIFLSHVLEHTLDLQAAVKEIHRVLADDGIVYVEVPTIYNYHSFKNAPLWDYPYEHINYFTSGHLLALFLQDGFDALTVDATYIAVKNGIVDCVYAIFTKQHLFPSVKIPVFLQLVPLIKNHTPCYVWGISQYMQLMLGVTNLHLCNIVGFIDSSEYKQGKSIYGIQIASPDILKDLPKDAVVIFPAEPYGQEMNTQLDKIKFKGKRIELGEIT